MISPLRRVPFSLVFAWLVFAWLVLACLGLISCGGGGGGSSGPTTNAANQLALVVDAGPPGANAINAPYASITICAPGTATCQIVDHLLIDTGASGVRILASVLQPEVLAALPQSTDGLGRKVAECLQFVSGYTWGSIKTADIKLSGETASNARIQVIADPAVPAAPGSCSSGGGQTWDSVQSLGANGTIGISTFAQDCGSFCESQISNGYYYACIGGSCTQTAIAIDKQVWNPVALFPADNNGTMISLPAVSSAGATRVKGTLIFGIGTQANNGVGSAAVLTVDSNSEFSSTVSAKPYPGSFIDSGSNGLFYGNGIFPDCSFFVGFYCPPSPQSQDGVLQGMNGTNKAVSFTVSNPESLPATINADAELAGPGFGGVDWGLPLFFGHSIYTAIEGRITPAGNGPWVGIK